MQSEQANSAINSYHKYINWIIILAILLAAFVFFMPEAIEYADYALIRAIPTLLSFAIIPGLIMLALILNAKTFKPYFLVLWFITMMVVNVISSSLQSDRRKAAFAESGTWAKAVVVNTRDRISWGNKHRRIKCRYFANHISYETKFTEVDKPLKIGDTINIIYCKRLPGIYHLDVKGNGRYY